MTRVVLNNGDIEHLTDGYGSAEKYLMERLVEKAREVWPNVPTFDDVASDPEMPKPNEYAQQCVKYSSLSAAAKEAHRRVQIEHEPEEPEEPEEKPSAEPNNKERSPAMGRHGILSQNEMLRDIRKERAEEGRRNAARIRARLARREQAKRQSERLNHVRRACNDYDDGSILVKRHSVDPEIEAMKVKMQKSEVEKMEEKKRERKAWTEESVIEAVKRFYDEQGRLPTGSDFKAGGCDYLPAEMTVRKHLGKKTEWLAAISHDEMDTMLRALSEAGLDDESDDPFEASGEALNFGGSKALQTTPARAAIVLNKAVHEMLDKVSSELDIASASVELIVEVSGVSNPVVMQLEF